MSVELTIETVEETIVLELQDHVPAVLTIDHIPELRDELDSKVDKVEGYSLVADDEIDKLSTVEQYAQKNTVSSVAGKQGDVLLDKSDVGLSAVDNTADADKPVSTAVAAALADKVDVVAGMGLSELSFTTVDKLSLDQSEQDRHTHSNKPVIDDLSDDAGVLQYKGLPISDRAALDAKVDKVAGKSLVSDLEIAKLVTVQENATANRADALNADKVHEHVTADVAGLDDTLNVINNSFLEEPSFVEKLRATTYTAKQGMRLLPSGLLSVSCQSNGKVIEYHLREDPDGMPLVYNGFSGDRGGASVPVFATNVTGSFIFAGGTNKNTHTTSIGDYVDLNFRGSELSFRHFADNRGGVWEFVVDDLPPVTLSTWQATAGSKTQKVVDGLDNINHTCRATFIGEDPLHAPSSGAARGWIDMLQDGSVATGETIEEFVSLSVNDATKTPFIFGGSVLEFAFSATPLDAPAMAAQWIPWHGVTGGARDVSVEIYADGVYIGDSLSSVTDEGALVNKLIINTNYTAYNNLDVDGLYPLWDGQLTHSFENGEITISHTCKYLRNVRGVQYPAMVPVSAISGGMNKLITRAGERKEYLAPATTTDEYITAASGVFLYNDDKKVGLAVQVDSLGASLNYKNRAARPRDMFIQSRANGLFKIYWTKRVAETAYTGDTESTIATYKAAADINMTVI